MMIFLFPKLNFRAGKFQLRLGHHTGKRHVDHDLLLIYVGQSITSGRIAAKLESITTNQNPLLLS